MKKMSELEMTAGSGWGEVEGRVGEVPGAGKTEGRGGSREGEGWEGGRGRRGGEGAEGAEGAAGGGVHYSTNNQSNYHTNCVLFYFLYYSVIQLMN